MSKTSSFYLETIIELLKKIEGEEAAFDKGAEILAKTVANDRLINIIGTGGHSNLGVVESFCRAGGLAAINPLLDAGTNVIHGAKRSMIIERTPGYAKAVLDAYGLGTGDVLVIVNAYGVNAMTIDTALECRRRGITSIGITSKSFADYLPKDGAMRHPSAGKLYELVDVFIDTHMPLGDAVVEVPGIPQKMGPTSTFINIFAVNLLMLKTAERLHAMGLEVPIWISGNMPEGDRMNKSLEDRYFPRVKHLR